MLVDVRKMHLSKIIVLLRACQFGTGPDIIQTISKLNLTYKVHGVPEARQTTQNGAVGREQESLKIGRSRAV